MIPNLMINQKKFPFSMRDRLRAVPFSGERGLSFGKFELWDDEEEIFEKEEEEREEVRVGKKEEEEEDIIIIICFPSFPCKTHTKKKTQTNKKKRVQK